MIQQPHGIVPEADQAQRKRWSQRTKRTAQTQTPTHRHKMSYPVKPVIILLGSYQAQNKKYTILLSICQK
jgi:hypothetical protein